ncbi:TrmB family transcriptional regulator sugar-binding domain-containing protein [Methanocaldococcus jannaschii]|nr:TrmB family transcriptional regulator sugar-binding domain-containing protein [Methanocaldococcus jannaschii]
MKKIGILEIVVILSILITSVSLAYKFYSNNGNDYEFDGNQMYKCAWVCEKILNKNFPLNATIIGKWTLSKKPFNGEVKIYDAKGGTLYAIYNGTPITIGGELAYQEDIAAKKIILHPIGKSIIFYELNPIEGKSFRDIANEIENTTKNFNGLNIVDVIVEGSMGVDSKTYTPVERQKIMNNLDVDIKKGLGLYFVDYGIIINGKIHLNTLKNLDNYINSSNISTSKLTIYVVVNNSIDEIPNKIKENYAIITLG